MRYNKIQTLGGRYKQVAPVAQSYTMPASVGGINALSAVSEMPPTDCLYCYNLVPSEYGLRLRKGYKKWATVPGGFPVNTILPYESDVEDGSADALFAVTQVGIYDVTSSGVNPGPTEVTFDSTAAPAGFGSFTEFTNDAGVRYLMYADEENGIFYYTEAGGWDATRPVYTYTGLQTPPLFNEVAFVTVWKNRVWLIPQDSSTAWYLDAGAVQGPATPFVFGGKLSHGGNLKGLFNWTIDGGDGMDDMLVAVGSGGDVLVYQGTDPTLASFNLVGSYYVGGFPRSRNIAIEYGGELYLLSDYGVISVRQLLEGVLYEDPSLGPSAKINRYLRDAVQINNESHVWRMAIYPSDGFLQIIAPYNTGARANAIQYQQNLMTQAWGLWRDVPVISAAPWKNRYMMGDPDGRVLEYTGGLDEASYFNGDDAGVFINYDVLTSYQAPGGNSTTYKRVGFIRPIQITQFTIDSVVRAVYDYELAPSVPAPNGTINPLAVGGIWGADPDASTWGIDDPARADQGVWGGGTVGSASLVLGTLGQGRTVAVAMRGTSGTRLTFVAFDISYQSGGFL